MASVRVGVIGLGGIATWGHLPGITRCEDFVLTALCDIDETKLESVGDRYGIDAAHRFTDYRDLIACPDVDAIDICTPNDCHFQMAMDAASAGKPYAVEKPVTLNAAQAEALAQKTRETGVANMVCFSYRFKAAARMARDLVAQGLLGTLYHVSMQYLQALGLPAAQVKHCWRFDRSRAGSGALGDLGCHALDLVRFITGKEYLRVIGDADTFIKRRPLPDIDNADAPVDVDDYCSYLARLEDGLSASFQITRFAFGRGNYQRLELYGEKGALVYILDAKPGQDELRLCAGEPMGELRVFTPLPVPERYHADQTQAFADIIRGRGDGLAATMADGLLNQRAVDAVIASFERERWVRL